MKIFESGCGGRTWTSNLRVIPSGRVAVPVSRCAFAGALRPLPNVALAASATGGARAPFPTSYAHRSHNPEGQRYNSSLRLLETKKARSLTWSFVSSGCGVQIWAIFLYITCPRGRIWNLHKSLIFKASGILLHYSSPIKTAIFKFLLKFTLNDLLGFFMYFASI